LQLAAIAVHRRHVVERHADPDAADLQARPDHRRHLAYRVVDIERRQVRGLRTQQLAVALQELVGAIARVNDVGQRGLDLLDVGRAGTEQPQAGLRVADDRGERLPHFVRHRCGEFADRDVS